MFNEGILVRGKADVLAVGDVAVLEAESDQAQFDE